MTTTAKIVSQTEWLEARKALLRREKELTHLRDALARERLQLPWVRVTKPYTFETPTGTRTLDQLFDDKSQLLVYHFMFGPDAEEGCPSCSMFADQFDALRPHLAARDIKLAAISRAGLPAIQAFKERMGWHFPWYSSGNSDFNFDFHVSFTEAEVKSGNGYYNYTQGQLFGSEAHGLSTFFRDPEGNVFHTYSCYARGAEPLLSVYGFLDIAPKGRNEAGLSYPMAWVRHHDSYEGAE